MGNKFTIISLNGGERQKGKEKKTENPATTDKYGKKI